MTLRLWLVRHGESTWNAVGRFQGRADPPLTGRGYRQAVCLARRLVNVEAQALYASPLQRCRQTAQVIATALNLSPRYDVRLEELHYGRAEGLTWDEILRRWPGLQAHVGGDDLWRAHLPGAESLSHLGGRVKRVFDEILRRHAGAGEVVVVTHSGVLRAFLSRLLDVRCGYAPALRFDNGALTQVTFTPPQRVEIRCVNVKSHLRQEGCSGESLHGENHIGKLGG